MPRSFSTTGTTIVDTSADIPTASAAYEGVMVFQKDTNELKICDGASWISVADTDVPMGLQIMKPSSVSGGTISGNSTTFSSVAAVTINGVFTDQFENYRIVTNISGAGNVLMFMRLRYGGTELNTNNYGGTAVYGATASTSVTADLRNAAANYLGLGTPNGAGSLTMDIFRPQVAAYKWFSWSCVTEDGSGGSRSWTGGGFNYTGTQCDGFSLYINSGTFSGTVRVYGYRNS